MNTRVNRKGPKASGARALTYSYDRHGDLIDIASIDDCAGADVVPRDLEAAARSRHLASSWGGR